MLCTFTDNPQTIEGTGIGRDILPTIRFELLGKIVDEVVFKVPASQIGVSCRCHDVDDVVFDGDKRDIHDTGTEINDEDALLVGDLLVQRKGDGSRRGFLDDASNVESCNDSCIFGSLTLRVCEAGWNRDNSIGDSGSEVCPSCLA